MNENKPARRSSSLFGVSMVLLVVLVLGGFAIWWWWQTSTRPVSRVVLPPEMAKQRALYDKLVYGKRLISENQPAQALEAFEQLVKDSPDSNIGQEAELFAAYALALTGQFEQAHARYAKLAEASEEPDARPHLGSAEIHSFAGDDEKAIRELNRVIDAYAMVRSDQCAEGLFTLAHIHHKIGQSARARAALGRVIVEFPGLKETEAAAAGRQVETLRVELAAEQEPRIKSLIDDHHAIAIESVADGKNHWNRTAGPYVVTDKVTVPTGTTLTIDPGVVIRFGAAGELIIQGRLAAIGTAENPIRMIPVDDDTRRGWWAGLRFVGSADAKASRIEHVRVTGSEIAIGCEQGAVTVAHTTVKEAITFGLAVHQDGTITATDSVVENGANVGVLCERGGSVSLERVTVRNNRGPGITLAVTTEPVSIVDSVIEGNRRAGLFFREAVKGTVRGCQIRANQGAGVLCRNDASPTLTGNKISDNQGDGVRCTNRCEVVIEENQITGNQGNGITLDTKSGATIRANTIAKNTTGIRCRLGSDPAITGNRIIDNREAGVLLLDGASPKLTGNTFTGNAKAALQNHSPGAVDARGNDWGTTDPDQIAKRIEDHNDNEAWGKVDYTEMRKSPTTQPAGNP